jgi:hypothetical protein
MDGRDTGFSIRPWISPSGPACGGSKIVPAISVASPCDASGGWPGGESLKRRWCWIVKVPPFLALFVTAVTSFVLFLLVQ